jgi:hypothetical protein
LNASNPSYLLPADEDEIRVRAVSYLIDWHRFSETWFVSSGRDTSIGCYSSSSKERTMSVRFKK